MGAYYRNKRPFEGASGEGGGFEGRRSGVLPSLSLGVAPDIQGRAPWAAARVSRKLRADGPAGAACAFCRSEDGSDITVTIPLNSKVPRPSLTEPPYEEGDVRGLRESPFFWRGGGLYEVMKLQTPTCAS